MDLKNLFCIIFSTSIFFIGYCSADYEDLKTLSLKIGEMKCLNVPNISEFLWNYHSLKNQPNFGDNYDELQSLLAQTKVLYSALNDQISYYAQSEHQIQFSNQNYFNLMIYWHIRSIQCQSLYMVFKWIEQDLLRFREDHSSILREVFDDGQFQMKMSNYIEKHYLTDLEILNQLDYDIFDFVRKAAKHVDKNSIINRLQKLHQLFDEINDGLTKDIISPAHDELYKNGLDFSMQSHVLISSTLGYYRWLTDFMRQFQETFQKHYP
ncbi:hypothetical protein DERF_007090 [Dermatophagoides farinae]|uniref:Uncharacterized protein n=1 Tax=Dermatophagoides farinae TaxID=6954 RepID=A0A922L2R3_DERFA|nr:hypothetical protein DERF_007090 [Dermatophagoides farinae]